MLLLGKLSPTLSLAHEIGQINYETHEIEITKNITFDC